MNIIAHNAVSKLAVVFVAAAMLLTVATPAKAQTLQELQALIAQLQAQIAALTGGSVSVGGSACTFTRSLTIGSQGQDVTCLQTYLTATGHFNFAGGATGYFGPVTRAAVAAWQAANGVSPAVGYFGPISQAKYAMLTANAGGGTGNDDDDVSGGGSVVLKGGAGSIQDADFISSLNNEEVGEDQEDVEVAGLEIEADNGSDIMITAVTLDFDYADSGADDDLDDYASEISVWFNGEEVARVDADEFDSSNNFQKTVSLNTSGGDTVIEAGETGELVVAVSGVANLDSTNAGENWNVAFEAIRFKDADGATISDTSTGDITDGNNDTTTDAGERQFSFESFVTAADVEMKFADGDDLINDSRTLQLDENSDTDDLTIFSFTIEIEGDSDITLDALPIKLTVTDADSGAEFDDVADIITAASLKMEGDVVGSESISQGSPAALTETVVFDNLDLTLEAGETYEFTLMVDVIQVGSVLENGDTIAAEITETETDSSSFDAEDESGQDLAGGTSSTDSNVTGTADAGPHPMRESGIQVAFVSLTETKTAGDASASQDDSATFTFVFDVTPFGDAMYFDADSTACTEDNSSPYTGVDSGINYSITNDGSNTTTCTVQFGGNFSTQVASETKKLAEGKTGRITLTVSVTAVTADHFAAVTLESINFDDDATDTTPDIFLTIPSSADDQAQSDPVFLRDNT